MGYKVLKQGWRLIAILAIGFSSGCSGNEKIKGPVNLSVRLLIVDLVGRYPANYLIRREAIFQR